MHDTWKAVISDYTRQQNAMEADFSIESILPFMDDEHYTYIQKQRLKRISSLRSQRPGPEKYETRGKIMHVARTQDGLEVYLRLMKKFFYQKHVEQRVEYEKVQLAENLGQWRIRSIAVDLSEKQPAPPMTFPPQAMGLAGDGASRNGLPMQSVPYLNRELFQDKQRAYYQRQKVREYADRWWNGRNPQFVDMDVDCTNYVSQCLYAGSAPMNYTDRRDAGWWYKGRKNGQESWSYSWSVSNSLERYLAASKSGLKAQQMKSPYELEIGDVITYDWDGDGRYQHSVVITAFAPDGAPLVNAHTVNSMHRYWDYRDSYAWSERTACRFFHIADSFT